MTSRLVLNLCHTYHSQFDLSLYNQASLIFAANPILGNIGAPLRLDLNDHSDKGLDFPDDIELAGEGKQESMILILINL